MDRALQAELQKQGNEQVAAVRAQALKACMEPEVSPNCTPHHQACLQRFRRTSDGHYRRRGRGCMGAAP